MEMMQEIGSHGKCFVVLKRNKVEKCSQRELERRRFK